MGIGSFQEVTPNPAVPSSGQTVTNNYGHAALIAIWGGTVSQITVSGVNGSATNGLIYVPIGGTLAITYSVAPVWKIFLLW